MTTTIRHNDSCDQLTLGWTALRVESEQGPELCVTVSELRRAREVYRDAGQLPYCSCGEREVKHLRHQAEIARKAGDRERYLDLLVEAKQLGERLALAAR